MAQPPGRETRQRALARPCARGPAERRVAHQPAERRQPAAGRHCALASVRCARDGPGRADSRGRRRGEKLEFHRLSGLYILALFILIFALWIPDTFLRVSTVRNIVTAQSITGVLSVGLVCAMAAGAFDLSFAQVAGTGSILAAILTTS